MLLQEERKRSKAGAVRLIATGMAGVLSLQLAFGSPPAHADWLGERIGDKLKTIAETVSKTPALLTQTAAPRRTSQPPRKS